MLRKKSVGGTRYFRVYPYPQIFSGKVWPKVQSIGPGIFVPTLMSGKYTSFRRIFLSVFKVFALMKDLNVMSLKLCLYHWFQIAICKWQHFPIPRSTYISRGYLYLWGMHPSGMKLLCLLLKVWFPNECIEGGRKYFLSDWGDCSRAHEVKNMWFRFRGGSRRGNFLGGEGGIKKKTLCWPLTFVLAMDRDPSLKWVFI